MEAPHISSPLHLHLILDELRVVGQHDRLVGQIQQLLASHDLGTLFLTVLARLEETYNPIAKPKHWSAPGGEADRTFDIELLHGLVGRFMSYLLLARHGLSEAEMIAALGVDRVTLTPFLHAVSEITQFHTGLLGFAHQAFVDAARRR